jgi:hypothetical protein
MRKTPMQRRKYVRRLKAQCILALSCWDRRYKDFDGQVLVGMCRWGSGLPDQPFRYTGTDVLEERDGRVGVFYTFIDSGTPPVSSTE